MSEKIYEGLIRDELASESGHSKAFIRQFSIEFFQAIREGLLEDGHVRLHQFGSFKLKWSQQRKGINPQTGEAITIAAHPRIIFTAAKHLKDEVNASLAPAVIASSIINPVINSKPEAVPEPIEPAETPDKARKPLPKLETEPYLNRPDNPTDNSNNESQISYRAMAAGFVLICSVSYFLLPDFRQETPSVNNHTAITSDIQKPNNVVQATTVTTAPVETAVDLASTTQTPEDVTEMSHTATIVEVKDARTNPVTLNPEQPDETDKAFFLSKKHKLVNGNSLWRLSKKTT